MSLDIFAEGPTQVLRLFKYSEAQSIFKNVRTQQSSAALTETDSNDNREGFEVKSDKSSLSTFVGQIRLEGIGVSLMTERMQELLYATFRGMDFRIDESALYQSFSVVVRWLQVCIAIGMCRYLIY